MAGYSQRRRDPSIRVRNEDRDKVYAYFQSMHDGKDSNYSSPYIQRADGASWEMRDRPADCPA